MFFTSSIVQRRRLCQPHSRFVRRLLPSLILAVALLAHPGHGADAPLPAFFSQASAARDFQNRVVPLNEAVFDLGAPGLAIRAILPGQSVADADTPVRAVDLSRALIAFGVPPAPLLEAAPADWTCAPPNGPIVAAGRWLLTPAGLWSAIGLSSGNHPVFSTSWLAQSDEHPASFEIVAPGGERRAIAAINRMPASGEITALTPEGLPSRRMRSIWDDAALALLAAQRATDRSSTEYLVYRVYDGDTRFAVQDDMIVLCARGDSAQWLRDRLRRNDMAIVRKHSPAPWDSVQECAPLGAPLIWEGRPVDPSQLTPAARESWGSWSDPAPALIAWHPAANRLRVVWTGNVAGNQAPADRQSVVEDLLEQGARYAFELFAPEQRPFIFARDQWVGWSATSARPPDAVCAMLFGERNLLDPVESNGWVNLCRAEPLTLRANWSAPGLNPPGAAIDGRNGEDPALDNYWESEPTPREEPISWLELEWRESFEVKSIELHHAGAVGFSPQFNTAAFRVLGRRAASGAWRLLDAREENLDDSTLIELPQPEILRAIRIELIKPNHYENNPRARLAEVIVWGRNEGQKPF